jgi:hypothetical protein
LIGELRGRRRLGGWSRDLARVRLVELADQTEAELFHTAFHRYADVHGRVVSDPEHRCSLSSVISPGATMPSRLAVFWSPGAARQFDRFWSCYRRVYGPLSARALAPVS